MLFPLLLALSAASNADPIHPNSMQTAAGKLNNGVLTVAIEARNGLWYPDGPKGMVRPVAAFAEAGKPLQNPGPLVRVTIGTEVRMTVHNKLGVPMWVFGLGAQRGAADSVLVEAGKSREVSFIARDAGVFYYAGKTTPAPLLARGGPDGQLNGAIIVDAPGQRPIDRLFIISWWFSESEKSVSGLADGATMVINGQSWPHTERLSASQGEMQNWRWINTTIVPHPLHLHGFYFTVNGKGDGASFNSFAVEQRRSAVTEVLMPGGTLELSWTPQRPGNWIFHCHFAGHMTSMEGLNKDRRHPGEHTHTKSSGDHSMMEGLVLGIVVKPVGAQKASEATKRNIRLLARSAPKIYGDYAGYGYVLGGSQLETQANAFTAPGPTLVLQKDEPVAITIVNQTHESAAVHWHGIELESFPDGVAGFSGYGKTLLPAIAPRDSFTVRFTPPRAGTFMYHSHMNEFQQIASGMYGAIVVLEPGQKFDPETDRIMVFSDNGPTVNVMRGPFPSILLNGKEKPEPMQLEAGKTYRFRMINIQADAAADVTLLDGDKPAEWKMVARDGATLPPVQVQTQPAKLIFAAGQIFDFEVTPAKTGQMTLRFGYPNFGGPPPPPPVDVVINVR